MIGHRLSHAYGKANGRRVVLRQVSLTLHPGEITLIVGPSGSGKTTLMSVLSGLLRPESGRVLALGKDLWALPESEREAFRRQHCGFIFQGYHLLAGLTAWQQLEMVLCWGGGALVGEARPQVAAMLEQFGLAHRAHAFPSELSGGEKQRVALGRALIKRPTLCFADEPTSALDWERGQEVIELLSASAREHGTTVLLVSHDLRLIRFADRVFRLEEGALTELLAPDLQRIALP